jgi:hypothetical protein
MNKTSLAFICVLIVVFFVAADVFSRPPPAPSPAVTPTPTFSVVPEPPHAPGVLGTMTKTTGCISVNGRPDLACSPGAIDPRVTQENISSTICVSGYSAGVRPPVSVTNKIKTERMIAYGDTDSKSNYELDHLVSLELGGCPDCVANLWPEPYAGTTGAHQKDEVENYLHKQVCTGLLPLSVAQVKIANDWESVYQQIQGN